MTNRRAKKLEWYQTVSIPHTLRINLEYKNQCGTFSLSCFLNNHILASTHIHIPVTNPATTQTPRILRSSSNCSTKRYTPNTTTHTTKPNIPRVMNDWAAFNQSETQQNKIQYCSLSARPLLVRRGVIGACDVWVDKNFLPRFVINLTFWPKIFISYLYLLPIVIHHQYFIPSCREFSARWLQKLVQ